MSRVLKSFHVEWLSTQIYGCTRHLVVRQVTSWGIIHRACGEICMMTIRLNDQSFGGNYCLEHGIQKLRDLATEMDEQEVPVKEKAS